MRNEPVITTNVARKAERCLNRFTPRRLAVFAWGRLGDSICRLPLIRALKDTYPQAELTVICDKLFADVFSGAPYIDHLLPLDIDRLRDWRNFREEFAFVRYLRRERFDAVFDPWGRKRSARYTLLSGSPVRAGVDLWQMRRMYYNVVVDIIAGDHGQSAHLIDHGLLLARAVGVPCETRYEPIPFGAADAEKADDAVKTLGLDPGRVVALNLGAAAPEKCWPLERFARLAAHLADAGYQVAVLHNPGRPDLVESVAAESGGRAIGLPVMTVKQLAAFARSTEILVSGDTGPLHIWQAMARPVVATAGVTHPSVFQVDPTMCRTLYHPEICVPALNCNWTGCVTGEIACIKAITVDEVIAACEDMLSGRIPKASRSLQ